MRILAVALLALGLSACRDSAPTNWPSSWRYSPEQPVVTGRDDMRVAVDERAHYVSTVAPGHRPAIAAPMT